jgi:hypothetical protein
VNWITLINREDECHFRLYRASFLKRFAKRNPARRMRRALSVSDLYVESARLAIMSAADMLRMA